MTERQYVREYGTWANGKSGQHYQLQLERDGLNAREVEIAMVEFYAEDVEKDFEKADDLICWLLWELGLNDWKPTTDRPA